MDIYGATRLAKMEHDLMVQSLPKVPEYGYVVVERKSNVWQRPALWLRPALTALLNLVTK